MELNAFTLNGDPLSGAPRPPASSGGIGTTPAQEGAAPLIKDDEDVRPDDCDFSTLAVSPVPMAKVGQPAAAPTEHRPNGAEQEPGVVNMAQPSSN